MIWLESTFDGATNEYLAKELGYQEDPYDDLGRLQAELFRAVRLVVDTGIHSKRWTRQAALDYMLANTGMVEGEVVTEIERYIVWPGQACAYKVGMLEILALREKARQALGSDFDLPAFHMVTIVLKNCEPIGAFDGTDPMGNPPHFIFDALAAS